ncbi:DUF485 domain-containing protein [Streptomyces sp. NPDC088387]|uniref:DUF485 domain-containing protein n=1 Tax=Streptomyces sp. NPDC088387 TaxID=3365859 RepID=UPI00382B293C
MSHDPFSPYSRTPFTPPSPHVPPSPPPSHSRPPAFPTPPAPPSYGPHNPQEGYDRYDTYPWLPEPPPAEAAPRRAPEHAPLGQHSDLRVLRSAYRWQRRTATLAALGYFTLFLVLSAAAPSFMTRTVAGGLPLGLVLALVQLPVTWLATALYEYTARQNVDPLADRIRLHAQIDARMDARMDARIDARREGGTR